MARSATVLAALACAGMLLGTASSAQAGSGVSRRLASAAEAGWQGTYGNDGEHPLRVVVRAEGDWYYQPRSACTRAGVPWSPELRSRARELMDPDCPPWSLLGRIEQGEEVETFCVAEKDHFVLPPGSNLSFAINEFEGGHRDNYGALHVEILALELAPLATRPAHEDGLALDAPTR